MNFKPKAGPGVMSGACTLTVFLRACCTLSPDATVTNPALWDAYMRWAYDNEVFDAME